MYIIYVVVVYTHLYNILYTQKCYTILFSWDLPVGFSKFHVCGLYLNGVFVQQQYDAMVYAYYYLLLL